MKCWFVVVLLLTSISSAFATVPPQTTSYTWTAGDDLTSVTAAVLYGQVIERKIMTTKKDLFEDIAVTLDSWTQTGVDATTNPAADLQWTEDAHPYRMVQSAIREGTVDPESIRRVFSECFRGFAVSILTILDGGTALAENGRLYVVNEDGKKIGEGLHEGFVGHLMDTGRL